MPQRMFLPKDRGTTTSQIQGENELDLTVAFQRALDAGGMPYALTDTHWSAEGHDIVAQTVKEKIDEMGWLAWGHGFPMDYGGD